MLTLWDLIDPLLNKVGALGRPPTRAVRAAVQQPLQRTVQDRAAALTAPKSKARARKPAKDADSGMQAKYDAVVQVMLDRYQIRVRKWRKNMSGIAWYVTYRDGHVQRLIEAPKPKGPMSVAIFLHEIGHHAIGFDVYKPRCLEEYHAWRWSLEAMAEHKLNITDQVRYRMHRSLWYAVDKARRRGIKQIPVELMPFIEKPVRLSRKRSRT